MPRPYGHGTGDMSGTTAVVSVVVGDTLTVANAGDSRAVISQSGVGTAITNDHTPSDEKEYARIQAVGGEVDFGGGVAPGGGDGLALGGEGGRQRGLAPRQRGDLLLQLQHLNLLT